MLQEILPLSRDEHSMEWYVDAIRQAKNKPYTQTYISTELMNSLFLQKQEMTVEIRWYECYFH